MTVTGRTLGENLDRWVHKHGELDFTSQDVIRPLEKPIKESRWEIEECHYEVRLWSSSCNRRVLRPRSTTHILPIPAFTTTFSVGFPPSTLQARSDIIHSFQIQFPSPHHLRGARTRAVNPPGAL